MAKQTKITENLRKLLMLNHGLSLSSLAKQTKIPQPTLHHIFDGKTKNPRKHLLSALADFFKIKVEELTGDLPSLPVMPDSFKENLQISTIPILELEKIKNLNSGKEKLTYSQEIIVNHALSNKAFAFKVTNNDLEPSFKAGTLLIFEPQNSAKDRDMALIYCKSSDELHLKRLFIENETTIYIKQDEADGNASLTALKNEEHKIIAILIEARIPF